MLKAETVSKVESVSEVEESVFTTKDSINNMRQHIRVK